MKRPRKWADEEVREWLNQSNMPAERCLVNDGLYGFVNEQGKTMICMDDDDDERAARIIKYLQKIGAPKL